MCSVNFLGAGVRIVVGAVPIDRSVFRHHFILPLPCHRNCAHLAEAAQPVIVIRFLRQQQHFERAPQVHVETAFSDLRFNEAAQWITESVV